MDNKGVLNLIEIAAKARSNAYAPYSQFKVGAALIDNNGVIHSGANVENGSYGLSNCAERSAIFSAVSQGMKSISAIAVVADTTMPVSPCGACRQIISEFSSRDTVVILANTGKEYLITSIDELLPYKFKL